MNELNTRISAYIPQVVRKKLETASPSQHLQLENDARYPQPETYEITAVTMFADVSGFTQMTESLAAKGPSGAESLGKYLNSYFEQMLRLISAAGGDVFKFAGDAMIVFWKENKHDTIASLLRRCLQCALRVQEHLHEAQLAPNVVLSVKMGIGLGKVTIAHLGGCSDGSTSRWEYVALGESLVQAFNSEHHARPGDVICTSNCWKHVGKYFMGETIEGTEKGFYQVISIAEKLKICSRRSSCVRDDPEFIARLKQFVPRAVWPFVNAHEEFWGSELRHVTVLFINLGFSEADLSQTCDDGSAESIVSQLQFAFCTVQKCVFAYEGTINKFLVDDKGSTVIAVFGLPPVAHENDALRGILASLAICGELKEPRNIASGEIGARTIHASIGITSGTAFCGVVGHQGNRREYTVLGDIVNLSARLMQRAKQEGGGVITDQRTKLMTAHELYFETRPQIMVKGKNNEILIYRPYPRLSVLMDYHQQKCSIQAWKGHQINLKNQTANPLSKHKKEICSSNTPTAATAATAPHKISLSNLMLSMHEVQVHFAYQHFVHQSSTNTALKLRQQEYMDNDYAFAGQVKSVEKDNILKVIDDRVESINAFTMTGTVIIEGEIGTGKSCLLGAISSEEYRASHDSLIVKTIMNPYHKEMREYEAWTDLILQVKLLLDASMSDHTEEEDGQENWNGYIRSLVAEGSSPNEELLEYCYVLNSILGTTFVKCPPSNQREDCLGSTDDNENDEREKEKEIAIWFLSLMDLQARESRGSWSKVSEEDEDPPEENSTSDFEDELDIAGVLILCILFAITRKTPVVFLIDNTMYMHEKSWIILTILTKYYTNCLSIVALRPPVLLASRSSALTGCGGVNSFRSNYSRRLRLLKRHSNTLVKKIRPLSPLETEKLIRRILNVENIPTDLMNVLISQSEGNPLFLIQLIKKMIRHKTLSIDEDANCCSLKAQVPWGEKSYARECFECLAKISGSKLDIEKTNNKIRCKACGFIFCDRCAPKACRKPILGAKVDDPMQHCLTCYGNTRSVHSTETKTVSSVPRVHHSPPQAPSPPKKTSVFHFSRAPFASPLHASIISAKGDSSSASSSTVQSQSALKIFLNPSIPNYEPTTSNKKPLGGDTLKNRTTVRPPAIMKSVLTTLLDQLTFSQKMIMKTASVLNREFDMNEVKGVISIGIGTSSLEMDFKMLERSGMIRKVSVCEHKVKLHDEYDMKQLKYEFAHAFMKEIIQNQLLSVQLDKLYLHVKEYREQYQKQLRKLFIQKSMAKVPVSPAMHGSKSEISHKTNQNSFPKNDKWLSVDRNEAFSLVGNANITNNAPCLDGLNTVLKSGYLLVRKRSSVFSTLSRGPLRKKRFGVLYQSSLVLQYDPEVESNSLSTSVKKLTPSSKKQKQRGSIPPTHQTVLYLQNAKISTNQAEVGGKEGCFKLIVYKWTRGVNLSKEKRTFYFSARSSEEADSWVYMLKYAIECLMDKKMRIQNEIGNGLNTRIDAQDTGIKTTLSHTYSSSSSSTSSQLGEENDERVEQENNNNSNHSEKGTSPEIDLLSELSVHGDVKGQFNTALTS